MRDRSPAPSPIFQLFASCARNLEPLLVSELEVLGAQSVRPGRGGVAFRGNLELAYRACLWSRLASRVLLELARYPASSSSDVYEGAAVLPWEDHLDARHTMAVFASAAPSISESPRYLALRLKDAVVDRLRERTGSRPSVDPARPDARLVLRLEREEAVVSLDLSGESLHRRHYREEGEQGGAPLKESLAAAVLVRAGWPEAAAAGAPFLDPMCGSGTLVIEAALLAGDAAPGLLRSTFGFAHWRGHEPRVWQGLLQEAQERRRAGLARLPPLWGFDNDLRALRLAAESSRRAGLEGRVRLERRPLSELTMPAGIETPGLVVTNAPYGRRLHGEENLESLYEILGARLREGFPGWRLGLLTADPALARHTRLRADKYYNLYNGPIKVRLYLFRLDKNAFRAEPEREAVLASPEEGSFANRLRKNLRHLGRWAKREGVTCYRLYDADIPEYAVAVDLYGEWAHVQEYEPPPTVSPSRARRRLEEVMAAVPPVLDLPPENVFLKVRRRQRGLRQYEKQGNEGRLFEVAEGGLRFLVNFTDYLDTGLFLDHRPTRALLRELAEGRSFLNLFGYTGAATVYAAAGGARNTTTVDLSQRYLEWARRNLELNGFTGQGHRLIRADVLRWLEEEKGSYDLIFLDPPTFSTSKGMETTMDVQRDHVRLIRGALRLLSPSGYLIFSSNFRRFRLDADSLADLEIENITSKTIPPDFARNPRIHRAWLIRRPSARRRDSPSSPD